MSVVKAHRFPVSVRWTGGRLSRASAAQKQDLEIATPPEFRGGVAGIWSPEELLVTSAASCYVLTLAAIAERYEVPLHAVETSATGHVTRRENGRFGFVAIEIDVAIETPAQFVRAAESAAERAKEACIVSLALEVPVHVGVVVRPSITEEHFLGSGVAS